MNEEQKKAKRDQLEKTIINWILSVIAIIFICAIVYGLAWAAKHGSYNMWYEDMVRGTINEMVKNSCIK